MLTKIKGLEFFQDIHRYRFLDEWVLTSVSRVCSQDLDPQTLANIEKYRHGPTGWEKRGNDIHRHLEQFLNGNQETELDEWSEWVVSLFSDDLFQGVETLATEYRLVDKYNSVAGSFDFLLRYKDDPNFVILGDLKTVASKRGVSSRKSATAQLGGYAKMLSQWHPKLVVTQCVTVVSGPGKTKVIREMPEDCLDAWEEAWGKFQATQAAFDF